MTERDTATAATRGHQNVVIRNFLTLGAGELVSRLIGFGGTIWIARQLGVEAYGVIGFAFALLLYFGAAADLGMEHLGPREVAEATAPLDVLASSMLFSRLIASAIMTLVMVAIGLLAMSRPDGVVLAVFGLTLLPMAVSTRWVHLGLENARAVSASRFAIEGIRVSLLLAFVHGPTDLYIVPVVQFAGEVAGTLLLFVALRMRGVTLRFQIDAGLVAAIVRRGAPLLVTNLLSLVVYNVDVVLLRVFRGSTEVGFYLAAYTLINFLGVLGNTATLSILPTFSRLRASADRGSELFEAALAQVSAVGLPVAVGGAVLAPAIILLVFGPEYADSALILRILIASIPLLLMRSVVQAGLIAAGRQARVLHTTAWAAAVTVAGDITLIPLIGMMGAAVTTVLAELTRLAVARHYAAPEGYSSIPFGRLLPTLTATAAMAAALLLLPGLPIWISVPGGAAVYVIVMLMTGGLGWSAGRPRITV